MREEGGELTVCLRIVEAGLPSDLSLLDADHDGRDDVGDERRVHVAQFTGGDTVRDQRPDRSAARRVLRSYTSRATGVAAMSSMKRTEAGSSCLPTDSR